MCFSYTRTLIKLDVLCVLHSSNVIQIRYLQDNSYKYVLSNRVDNSVDPDQLASKKPADLDRHCFHNMIHTGLSW